MGDFSRDSFKETQNLLNDLRGLVEAPQDEARHYVSVRLQQGVPVLDADWNEVDDIRRLELETVLVQAIGSGVPAGSNGFQIKAAGPTQPNTLLIEAGLLFLDGWLAYNSAPVTYGDQPHRQTQGVDPALPRPLQPPAIARTDLVYLDAWEHQVLSTEDDRLVDPRIGVETSVRLERVWVVRVEPIAAGADPLEPATIPNRKAGHRYYPLATLARQPGPQISAGMITDLRRTHLTLETVTHAPLFIDDAARGQVLNSVRLTGCFRGNLDATRDMFLRAPETFVFTGHEAETWQAMTAYHDVRASAVAYEQQATNELLHRAVALAAMQAFFDVQRALQTLLQGFIDDGIASAATETIVDLYETHLVGSSSTDRQSLQFSLQQKDVLGAVLAQERLNEAIAAESDTLPEGNVTASLISVTPSGNVVAGNDYQLTIRIQNNLESEQGQEPILVRVSAGTGWHLAFQDATGADPNETVVTVPNETSQDIVLVVSADAGAPDTVLMLTARPQRRQQRVFEHPPIALAIGDEILPGEGVLATLDYQGPPLLPGHVLQITRARMAMPIGFPISFGVVNLSTATEQYQLTVTPLTAATGWQTPNQPVLPSLAAGEETVPSISFRTTDQAGAVSPLTYRMRLVRVTGGVSEPLEYTDFEIRFELQL